MIKSLKPMNDIIRNNISCGNAANPNVIDGETLLYMESAAKYFSVAATVSPCMINLSASSYNWKVSLTESSLQPTSKNGLLDLLIRLYTSSTLIMYFSPLLTFSPSCNTSWLNNKHEPVFGLTLATRVFSKLSAMNGNCLECLKWK